ncbi:unnamed protein product [Adineta ricciae]|uniref:Reverse transcriptase n=1 Tax=Adineta ricciae TaxID=249248 RepID=A0A815USE3_ADIRI|nr:unnamed protein product [Adineta ricciae]CAF1528411.1 unnamed protein product [Adineta ricciae]
MVDTGATTSLISRSELDTIPHSSIVPTETVATLGDGRTQILINGVVELAITINNITTCIKALIVESLGANIILGMDWCKLNNAKVDIHQNQIEINHPEQGNTTTPFVTNGSVDACLAESVALLPYHEHVVRMRAPMSSVMLATFLPDLHKCSQLKLEIPDAFVEINDFSFYIVIFNPTKNVHRLDATVQLGSIHYQPKNEIMYNIFESSSSPSCTIQSAIINQINTIKQPPSTSVVDSTLQKLVAHIEDKQHYDDFLSILQQNKRSFDTSKMTRAKTQIHHTINTGDHPPINARPYYKTVQQRKEVQQEVEQLLNQGILRPSHSPWSSPILLKKKPDGSYRFLVDFRRLNSITRKDSYPQPSAEELLHRLAGHRIYTKLDLKSGYFQIPIHESDIPKTAIVTQDGLYEFTVLAQGLMNAPPTFQRVMNELLANGRWDFVVVYLDDIVIFSKDINEHKQHLADVLSTLHHANFQVSPAKCSIAVEKIEFLSHMVTCHKIEPSPDKIKAILDIAPPKTLSQANRFIGKAGYYRKFIRDFAKIAAPIHKVTNKTRTKRHEFMWGPDQQKAFEQLKSILTTAPLFLDFPDHSFPFILSTDASDYRIAGILKQNLDGQMKICYYKSRLLNDVERRYSTTEREALAIYWCLNELRNYIGDSGITIETDHKPLVNMHRKKAFGNKRIDNWLIQLQDMIPQILEIKYQRGIDNVGPDYLTRYDTNIDDIATPSCSVITRSMSKQATTSSRPPEMTPQPILQPTVTVESKDPPTPVNYLDLSLERIQREQSFDANIQKILAQMHEPQMHNFVLCNNLLHRLIDQKKSGTRKKLPYIPTTMIRMVLEAFHDHPLSGHFGVQRTLQKIRSRFWWPQMRKTIENYIASCPQCTKFNIVRGKSFGHLKSYEPPNDVFQVVHMDFWGPVRPSASGNRYVVVLTDNLSKYVIAKALPTNSAHDTANFLLKNFILVHGAPLQLITDQGVHFNNKLMANLMHSTGIKHDFSATYHPETNGQVERFNATFCTQLAKYYDENKSDWDVYLQSVVYAYNTGTHATTGFTPYELAYGRKQRTPFDFATPPTLPDEPDQFYNRLQKTRQLILQQAQHNTRHLHRKIQHRYNNRRKDICFNVNDHVFLKVCGNRTKLDERWIGPCKILDKNGSQNYSVETPEGKVTSAHVNQLRPMVHRNINSNTMF